MFDFSSVSVQMREDTPVMGFMSKPTEPSLPVFGFLVIGSITLYLPGRNGEVGDAARRLAAKLSDALLHVAQDSDRKEAERRAAIEAATEPALELIDPAEIPH